MTEDFKKRYADFRKKVLKERSELDMNTGSRPMRMKDRWKTDAKDFARLAKQGKKVGL